MQHFSANFLCVSFLTYWKKIRQHNNCGDCTQHNTALLTKYIETIIYWMCTGFHLFSQKINKTCHLTKGMQSVYVVYAVSVPWVSYLTFKNSFQIYIIEFIFIVALLTLDDDTLQHF